MAKNVQDLLTATAYDNNGDKLGDVNEVFVDDDSGQPTFVDVNHGLFGMANSLVPLRGHSIDGNNLTLAFAKDRIKDAPDFDSDKPLTPEQQTEIYNHYGISDASHVEGYTGGERPETAATNNTDTNAGVGAAGAGVAGAGTADTSDDERPHADFSGNVGDHESGVSSTQNTEVPGNTAEETAAVGTNSVDTNRGDAASAANTHSGADIADDGTLIRSEEHLNVDTERVETGEARLRKYVVTETQNVEVPVTREEVRVERTPISADEASAQATAGGIDADESEEASVTLHEERPVVHKETVPVEKVNLTTEEVSDTESVTEEVRKEQIDADGVEDFDNK